MDIAIAKPWYRYRGGFERVLDRVERALREAGHRVTWLLVDVTAISRQPRGVDIPPDEYAAGRDFFEYAALMEAFEDLDATPFDLLISTQPPSFAVRHERHLSLFYHHQRIFYDLAEAYIGTGLPMETVHRHATDVVRHLDRPHLDRVTRFLAGSPSVAARLARFNNRTENVDIYHAGPAIERPARVETTTAHHALCVSRHEFPKRTELFVQAMKYLPGVPGVMVGAGGRLATARDLDGRLSRPGVDLDALTPPDLWMNTGAVATMHEPLIPSNVTFTGHVSDAELEDFYAGALCVVAPAFQEDYGLTALEAMRYGKPIVVCSDGGGLADLVESEVTGLIVEPSGRAISTAIDRLRKDPGFAARLGRNGQAVAATYTWSRADAELRDAVERTAAA